MRHRRLLSRGVRAVARKEALEEDMANGGSFLAVTDDSDTLDYSRRSLSDTNTRPVFFKAKRKREQQGRKTTRKEFSTRRASDRELLVASVSTSSLNNGVKTRSALDGVRNSVSKAWLPSNSTPTLATDGHVQAGNRCALCSECDALIVRRECQNCHHNNAPSKKKATDDSLPNCRFAVRPPARDLGQEDGRGQPAELKSHDDEPSRRDATSDLAIDSLAAAFSDDMVAENIVDDGDSPRCGDALGPETAERLFDLFEHARYCSGLHRSRRHATLCTCTKYVMLHLRDCAGTLPNGDACPFDWCGLFHHALAKRLEMT